MPLTEVEPERSATVACVYERDRTLLEYFDKMGLRPGAALRVLSRNPDATLRMTVSGQEQLLGSSAAERIWVRLSAGSIPS